ncbi:hypothetical protein SELMODRAFT_405044 [Selaginella moellendorffii]|uniref:RING-type domain-containing protein n=1 Tax=Selaginella moellendorffii TaxID=88036 RepID=D8QY75_SELML|nr:hypothetical protein SELMODRAFT_405044 [Selaginella moellendorffii]
MPGLAGIEDGRGSTLDEKIATMIQLQQKEGGEAPDKQSVDAEFRRGLEELVRDHFDNCMALASSSTSNSNREDLDFQLQCDGCGSFDEEEGNRNSGSNAESQEGRVDDDFTGRPSQILRRWYDRQAQNVITTMERQARQAELLALAGLHAVSMLDSSFLRDSVPPPSSGERLDHQRRPSPLLEMWRGLEDERSVGRGVSRRVASSEAEREDATATVTTTAETPSPDDGAEQTPASRVGEIPGSFEASRDDETRQVADDGGGTSRQSVRQIMNRWLNERVGTDDQINQSRREQNELLDLNERERVRQLAREWLRPTAPREVSGTDDTTTNESWESQRRRDRQLILDLLIRTERERQQELEGLSENRVVSRFPHRGRLQSLLRGRFLANGGRHEEEERHISSAARELGQLRQRRAVSGLREGFRSRLESVVRVQATNLEDSPETSDEHDRTWTAARRMNELEEATAYNVELRELLGRRSVTNVLASEFRERLDQLIRSFIHRQVPWPVENNNAAAQPQNDVAPEAQTERPEQRPTIPPPPPPLPIQRLWQQEFVHGQWPRPSSSYMVWDNASQLRADISYLQQGLGDLQRMVETIVDMQMELQRSIRQEVAGALQRMYSAGKGLPERSSDGSQWIPVKKGTCCICCDKSIDSLLYRLAGSHRCGHMCTCLRCANQLKNGGSKCPMCRAPIVEVIRAFTIA